MGAKITQCSLNIMPQILVTEIDLLVPEYSFKLIRALFVNVSEFRTHFLVSASVNKTPTNRQDSQYPGSKVVEWTSSNPQWIKKTTIKTSWLQGPEERPLILPQQHLSARVSVKSVQKVNLLKGIVYLTFLILS